MTIWDDAPALPSKRDEPWHYVSVPSITRVPYEAVGGQGSTDAHQRVAADLIGRLVADLDGPRVVTINGVICEALSRSATQSGLTWSGDPGVAAGATGAGAAEPADGFEALNRLHAPTVIAVAVDDGVVADPIQVVHITIGEVPDGTGSPGAASPRTAVRVGAGSHATVIETYLSGPGELLVNASTSVSVGEGATLHHHRIELDDTATTHLGRTEFDLAAASSLRSTSFTAGATLARAATLVRLAGEHATAEIDGLYLPTAGRHHDHLVTVDHASSHCNSSQRFKGVVSAGGRGSFTGHVVVRPGTVRTDAQQSNRSLLLDSSARSDTRPWLEILADDVRASHGATVGRLDDDALFYLRSRGIPELTARELLIDAFTGEIVEMVDQVEVRDHLRSVLPELGSHSGGTQ